MKKTRLYLGIPSTGNRLDAQVYMLRELEKRYGDRIEFVYPQWWCGRIFHDFARNEIVDEFLDSDCDILWFLDSDVCPAKHVLDLITCHGDKWQVAGAPYPVFMVAPGYGSDIKEVVYTVYNEHFKEYGLTPSRIPTSGYAFVAGMATGCLFIKREVFAQLKKPYFEFEFNPETRQLKTGEDLGFCMKLNELDIKTFTDFSMLCNHYKEVDLLAVNDYAMKFAKIAVENYSKDAKKQMSAEVKAAIQEAFNRGREQGLKDAESIPL